MLHVLINLCYLNLCLLQLRAKRNKEDDEAYLQEQADRRHNAFLDTVATHDMIIARTRQPSDVIGKIEDTPQPPVKASPKKAPLVTARPRPPSALRARKAEELSMPPEAASTCLASLSVPAAYNQHVRDALKKHASSRTAPRTTSLWDADY